MRFKLVSPPGAAWAPMFVPLGMATVKAYLQRNHEVSQIDLDARIRVENEKHIRIKPLFDLNLFLNDDDIEDFLSGKENKQFERELNSIISLMNIQHDEIICFSVHYYRQLFFAMMLSKVIKRDYGNRIVFGGVCLFNCDYEYLSKRFPFVDLFVVGNIEAVYEKLIDSLEKGKRGVVIAGAALPELAMPDYEGLDLNRYPVNMKGRNRLILPIETSRGCIYHCSFCNFGKNSEFSVFDTEEIIKQVEFLRKKYKTSYFYFINQAINLRRQDLDRLCTALINKRVGIKWRSYCRADNLDEKTLRLMKKSGCFRLGFGLESASKDVLRNVRKTVSIKNFRKNLVLCHKIGIQADLYLIVGLPNETSEDANQTINFIRDNSPYISNIYYTTLTVRHNSDIHKNPAKYGVVLHKHQRMIHMLRQDYAFRYLNNPNIEKKERQLQKAMYKYLVQKRSVVLRFVPFFVFNKMYNQRYMFKNNFANYLLSFWQRSGRFRFQIPDSAR